MKYTDRFFKFPVKLYLTKDIDQRSDLEAKLGIELKREDNELDYIIGWESIDIDDICGFGTIFSRNKSLEDVRNDGFDCTVVYLKYGKEIGCSWSPKKFEEKLNQFSEKIEEYKREQNKQKIQEVFDDLPEERKNFWDRVFNR